MSLVDGFCMDFVEMYAMKDIDVPLLERIRWGPREDEVKIFIMEKYRLLDISEEVT